ncbi:LOW QUALITY PROTEIN: putative WRKY transcription factor 19 [Cinnamomum micranthum f. kanehirae]|uniref:Putative WRKY transcription factor 19 n=1 Tax=Cinnamomum micranthum f. kanehirae TaxID=337451 RepID=A0A443N457_9MAGN|nr:LOW QUALITY PROTEIN: putative WRKY transcription factor 19 [Cinnamomum micranthum f. kanehirae]
MRVILLILPKPQKMVAGPSPSCYADDYYPVGTVKNNGSVPVLSQWLPLDSDSEMLKLALSRGSAEVPGLQDSSASLQCEYDPMSLQNQWLVNGHIFQLSTKDPLLLRGIRVGICLLFSWLQENRNLPETRELLEHGAGAGAYHLQFNPEPSTPTDSSVGAISGPITSATSSEHWSHHPNRCRFDGCSKGARGALGLCIAHGSGQRCQKTGCNKGAESRTAFCKAHGGGRRCQHLGCTKER